MEAQPEATEIIFTKTIEQNGITTLLLLQEKTLRSVPLTRFQWDLWKHSFLQGNRISWKDLRSHFPSYRLMFIGLGGESEGGDQTAFKGNPKTIGQTSKYVVMLRCLGLLYDGFEKEQPKHLDLLKSF